MLRASPRRLKRIGFVMLTASVVLLATSVYLLSTGTSHYSTNVMPGNKTSFSKPSVGSGDDLTYKVVFYQSVDLAVSLAQQGGTTLSTQTFSKLPSGKETFSAPSAGDYTLQVWNHGDYAVNLSLTYNNSVHSNVVINSDQSRSFSAPNVTNHSSLSYSISLNEVTNLTAELVSPQGTSYAPSSMNGPLSGSGTVITPRAGNWSMQLNNNGDLPVNVTVSIGDIGMGTLGIIVFGFVLLPTGIAFLAMYVAVARREKKRRRLRELSE